MPTHHRFSFTPRCLSTLLLAFALPVVAAPGPETISLTVDATDLAHRIFQVQASIAVRPGPVTLY
ncbi:MAG: hypothetical protein RL748_1437, partial [Pseudomonadota bacterium]